MMVQEHGVTSAGGGGLNSLEEEMNWWIDSLAVSRGSALSSGAIQLDK